MVKTTEQRNQKKSKQTPLKTPQNVSQNLVRTSQFELSLAVVTSGLLTIVKTGITIVSYFGNNNNNNNNLHLYSANLYMNIFGCALQYCYIKFMLKVTKA